jgi:hypothetical protein
VDALDGWSEFNVAMVGATAALAGLVIVASSVNIAEIIKTKTITSRLGAAIASLVLALAVSGFALVPDIPAIAYGIATLVATVSAGSFQVHSAIVIARDASPQAQARLAKAALGFLPIAAYLVTGMLVFVDPAAALVAAALGCITAIASAIVVSWVALVEVLR